MGSRKFAQKGLGGSTCEILDSFGEKGGGRRMRHLLLSVLHFPVRCGRKGGRHQPYLLYSTLFSDLGLRCTGRNAALFSTLLSFRFARAKVELFSLARLCPVSFLLCLRVPKNLPFLSRSQTFSVRAIGQSMPGYAREREGTERTQGLPNLVSLGWGQKLQLEVKGLPCPHHTFD